MSNPNDPPPPAADDNQGPNGPDFWPRYAIFDHALKLSLTAALKHGVRNKPTSDWTHEEVLLVALDTWREENP